MKIGLLQCPFVTINNVTGVYVRGGHRVPVTEEIRNIARETIYDLKTICELKYDGSLTDYGLRYYINAIQSDVIDHISRMKDDSGREGCIYGDTEHDSLSVVYGYNLAIEHVIDKLNQMHG